MPSRARALEKKESRKVKKVKGAESFPNQFPGVKYKEGSIF